MNELPLGWTMASVGDICLPIARHRPEDRPVQQFDYIDISSIDTARNAIVDPKRLAGRDAPSRARQVVRAGDVLVSTVRTYLKNTAMVPPELDGATASTGFCVLRAAQGIEARYLLHRVLEDRWVKQLSERQTGTSYPAVRDADIKTMPLEVPPSGEQRRIVDAIEEQFSRLDAAEESLQSAQRRSRLLVASLRDRLARGPWRARSLAELGELTTGSTPSTKVGEFWGPGIVFVTPGDFSHGDSVSSAIRELTATGVERARPIPAGSVLLTCIGATIGKTAFARTRCVTNQQITSVIPNPKLVSPKYLFHAICSPRFQEMIRSQASSTTMPILNKGKL